MNKILKNRRVLFISLFLMAVLSISLGYAYVRSRLNINGSTTISQNSWIFYFDNVVEKDNNVATENPALIEPVEKRRIDFEVPLEKIQDTYEFNVDIVNAGSLKGQVDQIIKSALTVEQLKKLEFDIRYEDGTPIKVCDVIEPNSRKTITVRVRLKEGEKYQTKEAEDIPLSFEVTYVQYDEDRTCDDTNTYSLTIDPGVGTYGDKTGEVTIVEGLSNGTHVSLGENPTLTDYYFTYWEAINNDDYTTEYEESINTVTIKDRNAYVLAHYESSVGPYTLTIDPKGGAYNGSTELFVKENLRNGYVYKLEAEPELSGKLFKRWNPIVNNQYNTKYNKRNGTITIVDKNAYLEAEYGDAIAKIVETNKYYATIEKAFDAAEPGQTILLLDDTEENPLTEKKLNRTSNDTVILDLDGHKVTGELINNDILTIVNGTIENSNGTALINNGTLTLGVNDDEIDKDNVKIIGKNTTGGIGLQNKGIFNFYDGYLDAFVGLDGIFHDVPFEHYVFVDDDNSRDCQKVYVTPRPSNVIARSVNSNGGVMFYYNLQKAFNTSAAAYDSGRTLWIEAIDYIPGSYDLILDEGKTAFFDLKGYTVSMASVIRNYGNLTIKDSGNETTHTKGKLETSYSMENYGKLILRDLNVAATTNVTLMKNYGSLDIKDSTLTALNGYVMEIKDGKEMIIDNNTYFRANGYALYVETTNPFTIKGGNIEGIYNKGNLIVDDGTYITNSVNKNYGIYNEKRVVINGGTIEIQNENGDGYGVYNKGVSNYDWAYCTMNGGLIIVNAKTAHGMGGYDYNDEITMNGGTIDVSSSSYGRGIYAYDVNMTDGVINVYGRSGSIAGVYYRENANISGGKINTETLNVNSGDNYGVLANYGYNSSIGGNLEITSNKDCMYIPGGQEYYTVTMNGGNYSCGRYGIYTSSKVVIENVNVDAVSHAIYGTGSSYYHYYADITINSGNIKSSEGYGIYFANYNTSYSLKVGNVDSDDIPYIEGATTGIYVGDKYGIVEINKGNIVGKTQYGLYTQKIANIGKDDGLVSVDSPIIKGELYGVYTENEGETNFYDGILKGKTDGYYGLISGLPDAYAITDGTEEIDESTYETDYLISYVNFVKVGEIEYNSLNKAIAAIEESGTMELIASAPIKAEVTIPVGKSITLDLAGYSLSLSKQINNKGELTIIDSSEANSGGITCDVADCLYNTGVLNINDGTYQGKTTIIYNLDGVLNFNYGVLQVSNNTTSDNIYGIYGRSNDSNKKSEININGGTISVENLSTANNSRIVYAIYQNNQSGLENVTKITGGSIRASGQKCYTYGVYSMGGYGYSSGDVTLSDGTITVDSEIRAIGISTKNMSEFSGGEITVTSSGNDVNGIYVDAKANISGGTINVTSTSTSTTGISGIEGVYEAGSQVGGSLVINSSHVCIDDIGVYRNGIVTITGGEYNCGSYGIISRKNLKITNATIHSKLNAINGSYSSYNSYYPDFEITGGTFISEDGYGIYYPISSDYYNTKLIIGSSELENGPYIEGATTGVYIDDGKAFIYNGTIIGKSQYGIFNKASLNIGENNENVIVEKPIIIGGEYGLYIEAGTTNFYDGILKGKTDGYYGYVSGIPDAYTIKNDTEMIDGNNFQTDYLVPCINFVKVGETEYNSLNKAIAAIEESGTMELIASAPIKADVTIPVGKSITLDLAGYSLSLSKQINNNGELTIIDSSEANSGGITCYVADCLYNTGTLNINDGTYQGKTTIIYNLDGVLNFNDGVLQVTDNTTSDNIYGIYGRSNDSNKKSEININGGTISVENLSTANNGRYVYAIYQNNQSGLENVTKITGGSIRASGQKCYTYGVYSMGGYGYSSGGVTLSDGTITVDSEIRAIGISTKNMSEFSGGEITVTSSGNDVNGIYVDAKANISGGTINVTSTSTSTTGISGIEGVYEAGSQVGGSLVINSSHVCIDDIGVYRNGVVTITGGEYNCGSYGIISRKNLKITNATIHSKLNAINGSYSSYNSYYPNFEIIGGTFISEDGYGLYYPISNDYYNTKLIIGSSELENGPYIEGATTGVYIDDGIAFIYNGTIVGNTANGIYNKGTVTIGTLDGNIDITKPVVIGENYGLYSDNGTNNFYDGILKGKMYGYYGTINSIEPSTYINEEIEEISEIDWIKNYLKIQSDIVINVNKNITYNNIQNAVDEADENDVIKLIDNVQLFYDIDVPTSSNITLDLDGFHIRTTKTIINNGTLNIVNNNTGEESYISTGVDISILHNYGNLNIENLSINNISTSSLGVILTFDGGITTLDDVDISSVNNVIIYNGGTININNSSLTASAKSVHNEGIINAINSTIFGSEYGVYTYTIHDGEIKNSTISSDEVSYYKYNRSSIQTVRNTTITGGYVYNDKGTLNIIGGTILSPSNINNNIINKATMNFDGTIINDSCDLYDSRYYEDYTSIQNMSELSMKDVTFTMVSSNNGVYTMIKNTGTFNSNNSNFDVNRTINYKYCYNGNCSHYEVHGIDNTNTVNMEDGLIKIYDTSDASIPYTYYYGIKNTGSAISDLDGTGIDISGGLLSYGLYHDSSSTNNTLKNIDFRISDVLTGYGVYVNTGIITTQTGNVQVGILTEVDENGIVSYTDKNVDTAYGVYVNSLNSEFILGVKDESAAGATEDADVSIVNPIIAAKGTELGIGIKKYDGKFRFYDGILIGNDFAKPETPTETNHIDYRAMTYYDDINGLEYSIQEYSRGNSNKRNMSASMNNVYYRTINAAVDRSSNNDTIVVQKSMEESILIPNNKTVTVDLNNHILSGSITNNGKMTLINGEVTTTGTEYDKAIINNGTLYIGIDDGTIVDNYVIIIGNSVGLQNNGIACMYDGYIRGALPTEGNGIVSRYDYQIVNKVIDGYDTVVVEGQNISNITITDDTVYNFEYDEDNLEQIFTVDETGYYRLEVWGAQGGYSLCNGSACGSPGYGGYSKGIVQLIEGDSLYINIGSQGSIGRVRQDAPGGYNGGGSGSSDGEDDEASGGGGGATHIATVSGELSSLETQKDKVLIVAAGGGGASWNYQAGSAGGYQGGITNGTSQNVSNQVTGYAFGAGQNGSGKADSDGVAGGGSGWYGGYSNNVSGKSAGTGGSSYIGSGRLLSIGDEYKIMNGYNVEESIDSNINTQNTTSYSKLPESGKAKAGDGYVRITKLILEES